MHLEFVFRNRPTFLNNLLPSRHVISLMALGYSSTLCFAWSSDPEALNPK